MSSTNSLEQQLLEYRTILEHAGIAVIFTRDRRVERCNGRAETLFGWPAGKLAGQPGRVFYPDDAAYEAIGHLAGLVLAAGETYTADVEFMRYDGTRFLGHVIARAVDPNNADTGTIWIASDVTVEREESAARKRLLREQELIFERVNAGIMFTTQKRQILRCNSRFIQIFGYAPEQLVGQSTRILGRDDASWRDMGQRGYSAVVETGSFTSEEPFRHSDGRTIWCRLSGSLLNPASPDEGFVWVFEDVTQQRQAEHELRRVLKEQQLIFDRADIGIAFVRDRTILRCNRRFEEMLGFAPGKALGQSTQTYFRSETEWNEVGQEVYRSIAQTGAYHGETFFCRQDGTTILCRFSGTLLDPEHPEQGYVWLHDDVTARRATEAALSQSMREYALIFDNALIGISYMHQRVILRCNRRLEEICGFAPGSLVGQSTRAFYASDDDYRETARRVATDTLPDTGFSGDIRYRHQKGHLIWVRVNGRPVREGDQENWIWTHQDVTHELEAEEALRLSHADLEARVAERTDELIQQLHFVNQLIEAIPGPVFYKDRDGRYLGCNQAYADFIGVARTDLVGMTVFDIATPDLAARYKASDEALLAAPGAQVYESKVRLRSGEQRDVMFHKATFARIDGSAGGIVGVMLDITERKRMEERLLQAATVFDSTVQGVTIAAPDGTILAVNPAFTQITGYTEQEAVGRNPRFLQSGRHDKSFYAAMWAAVTRDGRWSGEVWNRRKDGSLFPEWLTLSAVRNPAGEVTYYIGVFSDIQSIKQAESELRIAATAFDAHQSMAITDADGVILRVNQAFSDDTGYSADEMIGKTPRVLKSGRHDADFYRHMWESIQSTGTWSGEIWNRRKNGEIFPAWLTISSVLAEDRTVTNYIAHWLDITARKQGEAALEQTKREVDALNASLEERIASAVEELETTHRSLIAVHDQLTQAETMASLGRMVAVIAHELNTPIGNSRLAASTLRERAHEFAGKMTNGVRRSDLDGLLHAIETGTHLLDAGLQRAAHLISSFKQIAVDQTSAQRRSFPLDGLIDEIGTAMEPSIKRSGCTLNWNIEPGIVLDTYPGPLGHVLINLIDNAVRHAFVDRAPGAIVVTAVSRHTAGPGEVELRVTDNGAGIPAAHQKQVFKPFFTTQMGRGGTGLGLSIAYNIVTGVLGGRIAVLTESGQGGCFEVVLPKVAPQESPLPS